MKNIEITLEIDGENKTFTCSRVKGRLLRETSAVVKTFDKLSKGFNEDVLDEVVDYVCNVFDNKFTREQYYDGVELEDAVTNINNIAEKIMAIASNKIKN